MCNVRLLEIRFIDAWNRSRNINLVRDDATGYLLVAKKDGFAVDIMPSIVDFTRILAADVYTEYEIMSVDEWRQKTGGTVE